ncbi:carbohydrate-binding module family 32 protein [Athelia psychrophila]|uniref:alpha,alpha-trehalase n=1 Tax=Athelia psychrophila TaxID=1759441 RepID=A0A166UJB5_9AGAM|nr:carbohydrate-binding module family 32 protein [Fibularhizoctonia sp. CBS 109695]
MLSLLGAAVIALPLAHASSSSQWTLTTTTLDQSSFEVQPYVANGYIGQRIPAEGFGYKEMVPINATADDGTSGWPLFDPRFTAGMVAGFYDQQANTSGTNFAQGGGQQPISTLPTWSGLYLTVAGSTYAVGADAAAIADYKQSMSIHTGVVSTSLSFSPSNATNSTIKLNYTLLAHRTRPNIGLVRLDFTLPSGTNLSAVTLTDVLDGAGAWRTSPGNSSREGANTIASAVSPSGIANVTAHVLSHLAPLSPSLALAASNSTGCYQGVSTNVSTQSQCYSLKSSSGKRAEALSFSVVKYVSIASTDAFPAPLPSARAALASAVSTGYAALWEESDIEHDAAWAALWEESDIVIPGAGMAEIQLAARASIFHLLANVREGAEGHGLGDNSIAPAGLTSDSYAGQVFWDADTWMFPSLLALFPSYAQSITNFRFRQLGAAKANVAEINHNAQGAVYPWTAGRFGNCTGVGPCYDYEYHLENDISLAQWQYWAATQNKTWLEASGWPVVGAIAEFWASQVVWNATVGGYGTVNETDPDEYANFRNNAAYTNAGVSVILSNALALLPSLPAALAPSAAAIKTWKNISENIIVLSDNASGIVLEYDGFNGSTAVKQADVVLLTYPLEYNQTTKQGSDDLDFYALATSPNGPGMTYSVFSIDASALSPVGCASWTYLLAASQPYAREPYYQFSEQTTDAYATNGGTNPAYTFLTGHGGFLQSFTHGFTGYRSRTAAFYLDPALPVQLTEYTVKGMRWLDSAFDVTLTTAHTTIVRRSGTAKTAPVQIGSGNAKAGKYSLKVGESLVVPTRATKGTLTIANQTDTSFTAGINANSSVVPGQYALAAIDGSNATTWQPATNATSYMTVDLGSAQAIKRLHFNWNNNPATEYAVYAGASVANLTQVAGGSVDISVPYDAAAVEAVAIRVGNLTDVSLNKTVEARYVRVAITGSFLADGRGGTLAEFAVI